MPIRLCHCNVMAEDTIDQAIQSHMDEIRNAVCLLDGVGIVFRESLKNSDRETANPFSCTTCFNHITRKLQKDHNLFAAETLPERNRQDCANCPRLAQCGIDFLAK